MKENLKYDPEDLESLLLHKNFHELYPEEKEFVLRHMEGPGEYESMRKTLLDVIESSRNEPWLEPDASIKANLMKHYASEEQKGFTIWLNTLFAQVADWFKPQPALRYAIAGLAVVGIVVSIWMVSTPKNEELLAENVTNSSVQEKSTDNAVEEAQPQASQNSDVRLAEEVADIVAEASIPPAPAEMMEDYVATSDDVSESEKTVLLTPSVVQAGQAAESEDEALDNNKTDAAIAETDMMKDQETYSLSEISVNSTSAETLHQIESVTIASKSKRFRNGSEKAKWNKEKSAGAPIADWDELFSLLYTAP